MIQEWQLISQETVVKGHAGKEFRKALFFDPKTKKTHEFTLYGQRDFSIILPVTLDGMVITIWQYYQGANGILQTLPGGDADFKEEKPEAVAKRELFEETGCESGKMIFTGGPFWISTRSSWSKYFTFLALDCRKTDSQNLDEKEDIEMELIPLVDWMKLTLPPQNKIQDPGAVIATHCAEPILRKHFYLPF